MANMKLSRRKGRQPNEAMYVESDDPQPELSPVDSDEDYENENNNGSNSDSSHQDSDSYDSDKDDNDDSDRDDDDDDDDNDDSESEESSEESFEDQGSSEDEDSHMPNDDDEESDDGIVVRYEKDLPRSTWTSEGDATATSYRRKRKTDLDVVSSSSSSRVEEKNRMTIHTDNVSSDEEDEDGTTNRIGRVPLHWYDDYDHVGYDAHGGKVIKATGNDGDGGGDRIDQALAMQENRAAGRYIVHDALNDREVELTPRQIELIRRVQGGAFAHPEHDAYPDHIDYFSGVNREISGLNSNRTEPKSRFQPSKFERMQVNKLIAKLEAGKINMDYLKGKIRDMNDVNKVDPNKPFMLWTGDEEDELNQRKGPTHIAAPKLPPPGHAESYIPPEEYLPTPEDLKTWEDMEPSDRPHGHLIPKKFPNLRSVGSYPHSVREAFERCLDLYLCPRVLKKRLNIDPESLVPRLPRASDLRPFPTVQCIEYNTPWDDIETGKVPVIRCVVTSPDGHFMASGASDGFVRLWEVQTARLLQSWNVSSIVSRSIREEEWTKEFAEEEEKEGEGRVDVTTHPVVCLDWNPNRTHHCLLAAVGPCIVLLGTGTAGPNDAEITEALLASAASGDDHVSSVKAKKVVQWMKVSSSALRSAGAIVETAISSFDKKSSGPVCVLRTNTNVTSVRWQAKGDYFLSVSPKAGASAVLIHQLSKGNSQQPFRKAKGEAQVAAFHPNKPFLFVASHQHIRIYHLIKQNMVKRLHSGCRWISSLDVHSSGDHLIIGTLDRKLLWFDLDLSATPYKTLKYHERALRSVAMHPRYPLMASASDDGSIHVFHCMVYSDLVRNPLIVPVKILRGHQTGANSTKHTFSVLAIAFHPTQPWIFSAGADGKILLFQDI